MLDKLAHGVIPEVRVRDHGGNWERRNAGLAPVSLRWAGHMVPGEMDWFCDQSPWKLLSLVWEKVPTEYIKTEQDRMHMTRQCIRAMLQAQLEYWRDLTELAMSTGFQVIPDPELLVSNQDWTWRTKFTIHLWSLDRDGYVHPSAQPRFTVHAGNAYPVCLRAVSKVVGRWLATKETTASKKITVLKKIVLPVVEESHVDWVMAHLVYPQPALPGTKES